MCTATPNPQDASPLLLLKTRTIALLCTQLETLPVYAYVPMGHNQSCLMRHLQKYQKWPSQALVKSLRKLLKDSNRTTFSKQIPSNDCIPSMCVDFLESSFQIHSISLSKWCPNYSIEQRQQAVAATGSSFYFGLLHWSLL